ncbi:hypothetical protein FXO38_23965 [Capsicum annuum]|nr:hypothetical protein FXO38_23965 [Capsicum annuum]
MSNSSFSLSSSSSIPKGVCLCGVKPKIKTSWTQLNTGRRFFCYKTLKVRGGCNYFDWYDDEMPPQPKRIPKPVVLDLFCPTDDVDAPMLKLGGQVELGGWLKLSGLVELGGWLKLGGLLELGGWLKLGGLLELAAWLELPGFPIPS